jgi:site-specific recombinase XerD
MAEIRWERYPRVTVHGIARKWLGIEANLGLAPNTIDAYGRALEDYLAFSATAPFDVADANRERIANYVHHLASRRKPKPPNVVVIDSGVGLANATLQQRLTAIRLFYDYLIEEGRRASNPVGRGRYTPTRCFGGARERGLIPRFKKLPWIPNDDQWRAIIEAAKEEPLRNRVMLALSYDAALRREEVCSLKTGDIDPSRRTISIRAENTKNRRARVVPYSEATSKLYGAYLRERRVLSTERGLLFLSESRRNRARPITIWTWSKVVEGISMRPACRSSRHIRRGICASPTSRGLTGTSTRSQPSPDTVASSPRSCTSTSVGVTWPPNWRAEWLLSTTGEFARLPRPHMNEVICPARVEEAGEQWRWPIDASIYDRAICLYPHEKSELTRLLGRKRFGCWSQRAQVAIAQASLRRDENHRGSFRPLVHGYHSTVARDAPAPANILGVEG